MLLNPVFERCVTNDKRPQVFSPSANAGVNRCPVVRRAVAERSALVRFPQDGYCLRVAAEETGRANPPGIPVPAGTGQDRKALPGE